MMIYVASIASETLLVSGMNISLKLIKLDSRRYLRNRGI